MSDCPVLPNFTQIPNAIFDYWISYLNPYEFVILIIMCRKIFSVPKKDESVVFDEIQRMTNIGPGILELQLRRLIKESFITEENGHYFLTNKIYEGEENV